MLPEADRERLLHMRDTACEACTFVSHLSLDEFHHSPVIQHGVQHCIFIIGEASARISENTKQSIMDIDWRAIRGMRNRLAHAYFDIDIDIDII